MKSLNIASQDGKDCDYTAPKNFKSVNTALKSGHWISILLGSPAIQDVEDGVSNLLEENFLVWRIPVKDANLKIHERCMSGRKVWF